MTIVIASHRKVIAHQPHKGKGPTGSGEQSHISDDITALLRPLSRACAQTPQAATLLANSKGLGLAELGHQLLVVAGVDLGDQRREAAAAQLRARLPAVATPAALDAPGRRLFLLPVLKLPVLRRPVAAGAART